MILAEGRLEERVIARYLAKVEGDHKTIYEMENPRYMKGETFEKWMKDRWDQPKREAQPKLLSVELYKICHCGQVIVPVDGLPGLRCTLLVDLALKIEGKIERGKILEMWEPFNGEWYHGYTGGYYSGEECP